MKKFINRTLIALMLILSCFMVFDWFFGIRMHMEQQIILTHVEISLMVALTIMSTLLNVNRGKQK
jgi:hypothetical protein